MRPPENPRCVTTEFFPNACGKCEPCSAWNAAVKATLEAVATEVEETAGGSHEEISVAWLLDTLRQAAKATETA